MKHAISWFEIPVGDYDRAKKFYETLLEAELSEMEAAGSKLALLPADQDTEAVGGALIENPDDGVTPSTNGTVVYLDAGPDLQIVLDRVVSAGGKIFITKTPVGPEMGYFAQFSDSEGNRVGLYSRG